LRREKKQSPTDPETLALTWIACGKAWVNCGKKDLACGNYGESMGEKTEKK